MCIKVHEYLEIRQRLCRKVSANARKWLARSACASMPEAVWMRAAMGQFMNNEGCRELDDKQGRHVQARARHACDVVVEYQGSVSWIAPFPDLHPTMHVMLGGENTEAPLPAW